MRPLGRTAQQLDSYRQHGSIMSYLSETSVIDSSSIYAFPLHCVDGLIAEQTFTGCVHSSYPSYGPLFWTAAHRIQPNRRSPLVWRVTSTDTYSDTVSIITYTNLASGQPNSASSCALLMSSRSYTWNDWVVATHNVPSVN